MKNIKTLIILIILTFHFFTGKSQELSTGFFSGLNFSDIHGNDISGYWKFKPGPVTGIFIDYSLNKVLGIQTGLNYSALYYEHKSYFDRNILIDYYSLSSYYLPDVITYYPYSYSEMMNFSYLSFPVQLRVSIPSKPQLDLSVGMFYSYLLNYSPGYSDQAGPTKNDFGYLYSAGLSYPLTENFKVALNTRYMTGRKNIFENQNYKNGSIDFSFSIAYNGFLKKRKDIVKRPVPDSTDSKIYITYYGGEGLLWNSAKKYREKDASSFSPSFGFLINFQLASKSSFRTGLSFERTGYSVKDSSNVFYGNAANGAKGANKYFVDTKVAIDYIVIPALLNFSIGKSERFFLNTGPYLGAKLNARCTGVAYQETKSSGEYSLEKITIHDDLDGAIKNCDFGWIFGSEVSVPFSHKFVVDFGLQYKAGLIDVFNKKYFGEAVQPENTIRNGVLSFRAGIRIPVLK
jgi:hypothetical protein